MGLSLIAITFDWQLLIVILEVGFALSMVVFVHELGHYAVAKWCGVKVEKFYLGFDIYGLKLARFRRGETEYGVGIVPFGGYVKMLGQDDNPSHAAHERERSQTSGPEGKPTLDPRSYMAKTVPQRMAIISAGVIMNVIFALFAAVIAFSLGVHEVACGISSVLPGEAAWKANLQPGDKILEINDSGDRQLRFRDLRTSVMLANLNRGVNFLIQREGVERPFVVNVKPDPDKKRMRPTIGVAPPETLVLADKPTYADTPAGETHAFKPGDKIVAVDGKPMERHADFLAELARREEDTLRVTVERQPGGASESRGETQAEKPAAERVEIEVPARPGRTVGLVMKMGKITAVQSDSPAEAADLHPGDFITAIDGQPPGDPMRLPLELQRRAGETVTITISREGPAGRDELLDKHITLRTWRWPNDSGDAGSGVDVSAVGITYKVLNVVHEAAADSPAARAELRKDGKTASVPRFAAGDEIVSARFVAPKTPTQPDTSEQVVPLPDKALELSADSPNWPYFCWLLQRMPDGVRVELTLSDGRSATLDVDEAEDWYVADRGFRMPYEVVLVKAHSFNEAISLGAIETRDAVLQVYMFLQKLWGGQISPFALGGPKAIAQAAGYAAYDGLPELLVFLTLLSANLAVINFLPIPLLDGGHMMFLILEGVMRRPVSERVVVAFHYAGFLFIISLMLFVLGLDFNLIPRPN
ncbi:MAG TPA: site-2 protease family protein [Pirellulales bacterium]|nr:site-2 protease family protein [Pirellulales bacterium]